MTLRHFRILAAFLDKTKAEQFVEKYNRGVNYDPDKAEIEEYEEGVPFDFNTLDIYEVRFYYDIGARDATKVTLDDSYDYQNIPRVVTPRGDVYSSWSHLVTVAAKDEEHAFKIACDTLAKWKAEQEEL